MYNLAGHYVVSRNIRGISMIFIAWVGTQVFFLVKYVPQQLRI